MVELVDTMDLGSIAYGRAGSSPVTPTKNYVWFWVTCTIVGTPNYVWCGIKQALSVKLKAGWLRHGNMNPQ